MHSAHDTTCSKSTSIWVRLSQVLGLKSASSSQKKKPKLKLNLTLFRSRYIRVKQQRAQLRQRVAELSAAKAVSDQNRSKAKLVDSLARGATLTEAVINYMRETRGQNGRLVNRSLAHSLLDSPEDSKTGMLCTALHCSADKFTELALKYFKSVGDETSLRYAPAEYIAALLEHLPQEGTKQVLKLLETPSVNIPPESLFKIITSTASKGHLALSERLLTHVTPALKSLPEPAATQVKWMQKEFARRKILREQNSREIDPACVRLALLDYKMLDYSRMSSNIGDYVQTIAMLSNLVRFQNVTFESQDPSLSKWVDELRKKLRPEFSLNNPDARVFLDLIDRDSASANVSPHTTWAIAFGWYMHPEFRTRFDFPFADNIRPIFISFHINNRAMLDEKSIAYLTRYQPIGCRDWTTVYLLREFGIKAFFSGCMTTTIGKVFTPPAKQARNKVALVDYTAKPNEFGENSDVIEFTHVGTDVRNNDMITNLNAAYSLLESYRNYSLIATSRLHCHLPCTSIGLDTIFKPKNLSDVRFEGLLDLNKDSFSEMRSGIETKVAAILAEIFSGVSEELVYKKWSDLCAKDVEEADTYCRTLPPPPKPSFDIGTVVGAIKNTCYRSQTLWPATEDRVHVAFATDSNMADVLPVVMESVSRNCSKPLRIHILTRGLPQSYWKNIEADFAHIVELEFFDFDQINFGSSLRMLKHTTVSTMDRLLLADLLNNLDKVIYLDTDIVVLGDLAELWAVDVSKHRIAGKSSNYDSWKYGYNMVYRCAASLDHHKAWELRRRLHAEGPLVFRAFNAGVVIMNLRAMREDNFAQIHIPYIENYGMNDQDALNVYARTNRVELDLAWNAVPSQDDTDNAKILHFAGPVKPWNQAYITRKVDFINYRNLYIKRINARNLSGN